MPPFCVHGTGDGHADPIVPVPVVYRHPQLAKDAMEVLVRRHTSHKEMCETLQRTDLLFKVDQEDVRLAGQLSFQLEQLSVFTMNEDQQVACCDVILQLVCDPIAGRVSPPVPRSGAQFSNTDHLCGPLQPPMAFTPLTNPPQPSTAFTTPHISSQPSNPPMFLCQPSK